MRGAHLKGGMLVGREERDDAQLPEPVVLVLHDEVAGFHCGEWSVVEGFVVAVQRLPHDHHVLALHRVPLSSLSPDKTYYTPIDAVCQRD